MYIFDRRDGKTIGRDAGLTPCGIESERAGRGKPRRQLTGKWNVQFTDASGIVRRLTGFTDKSATVDLERGIPVFDEYGRKADFHCLRGTTATLLSEASVPLPTVQQIMRHSNPALTAKHYVRLSVVDKARALEKMPDFHPGKPEFESMRATGTDGRSAAESVDTPVDTDRGDYGLFQATNSYTADIIKPTEIGGFLKDKSLTDNELKSGGRHWARTSDPQLVELVL